VATLNLQKTGIMIMVFNLPRSLPVKVLVALCLLFCLAVPYTFSAEQATAVYESVVFNEDATWRGTVLVKGSVVVAPQATLRIEPGTTVRFAPSSSRQQSNLVILGRLQASGTAERPILFTAERSKPARGAWGGIVFLATEKKNILERCRIEYAEAAVELRYSAVNLKSIAIAQATTGLLGYDGIIQMSGSTISDSVTAVELHNGEFDGKDVTVSGCQNGFTLNRSALVLAAAKVLNCLQTGFAAEESRVKISGSDFSGNEVGARFSGGEGQLVSSRFTKNRETALQLAGARIKVQRCLFDNNTQDAVRVEDGRSLLYNNAFGTAGRYNIYNAGREGVSARQNWWNTTNQADIAEKIYDSATDKKSGAVSVSPWLTEKPPLTP
jgi:hypothetical protein